MSTSETEKSLPFDYLLDNYIINITECVYSCKKETILIFLWHTFTNTKYCFIKFNFFFIKL